MTPRHITNNLMDGPRIVAAVTRIGMIISLVLTTIMWANNSWGKMELNFVFVFISFFGVLYTAVSPVVIVPWLGLYTLSPAAAKDVKQVLLKLLLNFMLTATFLATWSFGASPWSFWALFALLLGLLTWELVHKDDLGSVTKKLQFGYILICIILVLLKTMGVDLGSKVDASTLNNLGNRATSFSLPNAVSGAGSVECSDHVPLVEHGMRITVAVGCPVKVDQMNMRNGTDFKLVDPALRAVTGRQQLVTMDPDNNNRFVTFQANAEGLRRYDRTAVEVELYHAGTGDAEVARRYGVVTPDIDLAPAR